MAYVITKELSDLAARIWAGSATDAELIAAKVEDVVAIKSDCEHMRRAFTTRAKPKTINREERTVEHVASDESADRMGDIIRVKGWELGPFKANPLLLRYHDNNKPPLGLVLNASKGKKDDGDPALITLSQFHADDKQDDEGRVLARLVLDGDLPAVSVGFMPLATMRPETGEEREKMGLGPYGVVYERAQLLELSIVTVPANANALMRKLDAMVEAGEVEKSLAAMLAKDLAPATRVVVPVAKVATVDVDALVLDIAAKLSQIQTSLSDGLAALKAQLDRVTRADAAVASKPGPVPAHTQAEPDPRATAQAYGEALLAGAVDALKQRAGSKGPRNGPGN